MQRCLNDYINELDRQHEKDTLALALVERVTFFYNYDLTDSVYKYAPQTVEMLREQVETHRDGAEPNDDLTMLCVKVLRS